MPHVHEHTQSTLTYLGVELHVLSLLVAHHNGVVQVHVEDGNHLVLRRLEQCVLDVAVHDVQDLTLGSLIPVGMGAATAVLQLLIIKRP